MTDRRVSLIIVSRQRPEDLRLVLTSLRYQTHTGFEVITVGDTDPRTAFPDLTGVDAIRHLPFDEANISAARNLGLAAAAGELVAFCDDDAVPEPTWLAALTEPFADPEVGAAGGFVRGRNGISYQWQGRRVDGFGVHAPIRLENDRPQVLGPSDKGCVKTEGTNCAFRLSALREVGGFDRAFRYYLDETDVNLRLSAAGWKTALVPLAEVQHGFAASTLRRANRAPRSLFEIGASKAVFGRRHLPGADQETALDDFRAEQHRRLIDFMVRGLIEPRDVTRLMETLDRGIRDGMTRAFGTGLPAPEVRGFTRFPSIGASDGIAIACRTRGWQAARRQAMTSATEGNVVTVFRLSLTTLYHRSRFMPEGYWLQTGGVFGRSDRSDPLVRLTTLQRRVRREVDRVKAARPLAFVYGLKTK